MGRWLWVAIGLAAPTGVAWADACTDNVATAATYSLSTSLSCSGNGYGQYVVASDPSVLSDYRNCTAESETGPERVFRFTCNEDTFAWVELRSTDCDLDIFVLGPTCDSAFCLEGNTDPRDPANDRYVVEWFCEAGLTYNVVVEGWAVGFLGGLLCPNRDPAAPDPRGAQKGSNFIVEGGCDEQCDDAFDNDNDGANNCSDPDCATDPACADEVCNNGVDDDGDGNADCEDSECVGEPICCDADGDGIDADTSICGFGGDCDDLDDTVFPGAAEVPADGIDQDCDDADDCWVDGDFDGYGDVLGGAVVGDDMDCTNLEGEADNAEDCDDFDPLISPAAAEIPGDNIDQDCDSLDACWVDADGDTYGSGSPTALRPTCAAAGYAARGGDCNDGASAIRPGASETPADGVDQDCSGGDTCWRDGDGDTWGTATTVVSTNLVCGDAALEASRNGDCDDARAAVYPGAAEVPYDGLDNDCAGGDRVDVDGDGATASQVGGPDCNDSDPSIKPGATEVVADGIDQDCDTFDSCYQNTDGDGYGTSTVVDAPGLSCSAAGVASVSGDCDDTRSSVFPGAAEVVGDGRDQDCDSVDSCYRDQDGDEFGSAAVLDGSDLNCRDDVGRTDVGGDCDDLVASVYPSAAEVVADGIDQDCDAVDTCYRDADGDTYGTSTLVDADDLDCADGPQTATRQGDCDDAVATTYPGATDVPYDGIDNDCTGGDRNDLDGDGVVATQAGGADCNDNNAAIKPGAAEVVADGIDQDCDTFDSCYQNTDGDGYGTSTVVDAPGLSCSAAGVASVAGDCDDTRSSVFPGAAEVVGDGRDQDCDAVDSCYRDQDGDEFGSAVVLDGSDLNCRDDVGRTDVGGDCDDLVASVYPSAAEVVADGIDQDCDAVDTCYRDADGDTYGTSTLVDADDLDCADGPQTATRQGDCDDAVATTHPGATDVPYDGIDNDCTGGDRNDLDGDGVVATQAGGADCNDNNAAIKPGAAEVVADGIDQDCDTFDSCHRDFDGDGDGRSEVIDAPGLSCAAPGVSDNALDCDDTRASVYLGAPEVVGDGRDQDCDSVDSCYRDQDGDEFGSAAVLDGSDLNCRDDVGRTDVGGDCDDLVASVYPSAAEVVADGIDQDCDAVDTCYRDADGDTYGTSTLVDADDLDCADGPQTATRQGDCDDAVATTHPGATDVPYDGIDNDCTGGDRNDLDGDGVVATQAGGADCNDNNAAIKPGAAEVVADGIDQDCDTFDSCHRDFDGDGDGRSEVIDAPGLSCAAPGVSDNALDCDDTRASVYLGAPEVVGDGRDQDCDLVDSCWRDQDGDRFGSSVSVDGSDLNCADDAGRTDVGGDCNDLDAAIKPGATEVVADGIDQDCDLVDTCYADVDSDTWGAVTHVDGDDLDCADGPQTAARSGDCADGEASVHPGAIEIPYDGIDQDCSGGDADDQDGDLAKADVDCDDEDATVYPGAAETVADGVDQDCDGVDACWLDADNDGWGVATVVDGSTLDCADGAGAARTGDCNDARADTSPDGVEVPYDGIDQDCADGDLVDLDGDGEAGGPSGPDCADELEDVFPGATELPNGVDDDCDGVVDEGTTRGDDDGDGYTELGGDCDDADALVRPGATEVPNGEDDDCDAEVDDGTNRYDDDADGFTELEGDCNDGDDDVYPGAPESNQSTADLDCDGVVPLESGRDDDGDGYGTNGGDCDDEDPARFPHAIESPNGLDDDCDGTVDEGTALFDDDRDGASENGGDCNDADDAVGPAASELPNGVDDDCDGTVDEGTRLFDDDGDGFTELPGGDCDDAVASVFPYAPELDNGQDDDCDGAVDEGLGDDDGDGWTDLSGDCDDASGWVFPNAPEVCDGLDNDCDGTIDEFVCDAPAEDTDGDEEPEACACASARPSSVGIVGVALALAALRRRRAA